MKNDDVIRIENLHYNPKIFEIRWQVTMACNYACDFCIQGDRETHVRLSRGETASKRKEICRAIIQLMERLDGYETIHFNLIGGEVTILQDFPDILEALSAAKTRKGVELRFMITTNFSAEPDYYCRLCDLVRIHSKRHARRDLHIGVSYYPEYLSEDDFFKKIYAIRKHIKSGSIKRTPASIGAGIPIFSDDDYFVFQRMRRELEAADIRLLPIIIRNYETHISPDVMGKLIDQVDSIRVTDSSGKQTLYPNIQSLGAVLEDVDAFDPHGYLCDAGVNGIWIGTTGEVKRCPAIGSTMTMGNINEGAIKLLDGPEVCTSDHCSCNAYGTICRKRL